VEPEHRLPRADSEGSSAKGVRSVRSVLNLLVVCCVLIVVPASVQAGASVRAEGYLGYARVDAEFGPVDADDEAFNGGGALSLAANAGRFYVQGDFFGDGNDFDDAGSTGVVGAGFHMGWRNPDTGSFGIIGTYNRLEVDDASIEIDLGNAGLEGEVYLDQVTLSATALYTQIEDDTTAAFRGAIAFYPNERIRLDFFGGGFDLEEDDPFTTFGLGGEFFVTEPISAFARWEGTFLDAGQFELDQNAVVVGIRLYWAADDTNLLAFDRKHFARGCQGVRYFFARTC